MIYRWVGTITLSTRNHRQKRLVSQKNLYVSRQYKLRFLYKLERFGARIGWTLGLFVKELLQFGLFLITFFRFVFFSLLKLFIFPFVALLSFYFGLKRILFKPKKKREDLLELCIVPLFFTNCGMFLWGPFYRWFLSFYRSS